MWRALFIGVVSLSSFVGIALAQHHPDPHHHHRMTGQAPMYDLSTETTVKGTVSSVDVSATCSGCDCPGCGGDMGPGGAAGTHLVLAPSALDVHVGPTWFLKEKGWQFAKGDEIEILGSRVAFSGTTVLVAREIRRGDETLTLRDAKGLPLWSASRRPTP